MALDLASRRKESEAEDFSAIFGSLLSNNEVSDKPLAFEIATVFRKHSRGNYRRLFKLARGGGPDKRYRQSGDVRDVNRPLCRNADSLKKKSMSVHHKEVSTNNHLIAAMTQAEAVIQYLTIKGVSVKGVILHDCKPVIRIEHHMLCEQLLKKGSNGLYCRWQKRTGWF